MPEDKFNITALGRREFVLPFGAVGFNYQAEEKLENAIEYIFKQDYKRTLFILDEDLIENIQKIEEAEERGANILILKAWGKSKLAKNKIRRASIKAIGADILKE
ncbi:MAG: hypothetical protein ACQEQC_01860 [Elusimicrobiota bacterium]